MSFLLYFSCACLRDLFIIQRNPKIASKGLHGVGKGRGDWLGVVSKLAG